MFWLNFTSIRLHEGIQAGSGLDVKKAVDSKHNLCDERRRRQLEREVEAMTTTKSSPTRGVRRRDLRFQFSIASVYKCSLSLTSSRKPT